MRSDEWQYLLDHPPDGVSWEEEYISRCVVCDCPEQSHDSSSCPSFDFVTVRTVNFTSFGVLDARGYVKRFAEDGSDVRCVQCLYCRHYDKRDADWGWCRNRVSQYYHHLVFEHWTCRKFRLQHSWQSEDYDLQENS